MGGLIYLAIILFVLFAVTTINAFLKQAREVRLPDIFRSWREKPRWAIIVAMELLVVLFAGVAATIWTKWVGAAWTVIGIIVAVIMVSTIYGKAQPRKLENRPPEPPETKDGRPRQDTSSPLPAEGSAETGAESPARLDKGMPRSSPEPSVPLANKPPGERSYGGVAEWRTQVHEDFQEWVVVYEHAVNWEEADTSPPLALCGYQYDPLDVPVGRRKTIWGLGVPRSKRCPKCTKELRDIGYRFWDIDPGSLINLVFRATRTSPRPPSGG